ncbi:OsmC family protein [Taibaiella soli]|uniref:OsmC family peroxiredoxin n=1 Tax=Taibaiella soli TaxID=1649169 RepID=A0A2W2AFP1_9BACT|nr:OsmC family protein [Taibaiella soli]PZF74121.1 OsmC family peroxiredoxin [Taibaiella soli]
MTSQVIYQGELRTIATHLQSGTVIETDAPVDNHGKGERFSPTDLVATALASCMATVMGILARTHEFSIDGTRFDVEKVMVANPRRIGEIKINITFPKEQKYDEKQRSMLQKTAMTCPVLESLHPDCQKTILFIWP